MLDGFLTSAKAKEIEPQAGGTPILKPQLVSDPYGINKQAAFTPRYNKGPENDFPDSEEQLKCKMRRCRMGARS